MPFTQAIRTQALVAAARHCCVCHRYNGVGVEVHHINPEAQSADNTAANAIALCFDCHAAAGHYNPQHPKGTKFSPRELRLARDTWHQTVQTQSLDVPSADVLYCRYLLCKSLEDTYEIARGDLSNVPVPSPLLIPNEVSALQRAITQPYGRGGRPDEIYGRAFPSAAAYYSTYPQAQDLSDPDYPYFSAVRPVTAADGERVAREDPLVRSLLGAGVPAGDLLTAYALYDECGGGGHQEAYRIRPLWSVYLAATNLSDAPLQIQAVFGHEETPSGLALRPTPRDVGDQDRHRVPPCRLPPGGSLLLPVATLLGALDYTETEELGIVSHSVIDGQDQSVLHENMGAAAEATEALGAAFWPNRIATGVGDQPIHRFDPTNLYTVTRYWNMGCCPHLFVQTEGGLRYVRELFVETPGTPNSETWVVPPEGHALVVAELEDETTTVESVEVNGVRALGPITLVRGDRLELDVRAGDVVRFTGCYVSSREPRPQPWRKNGVLASFSQTYQPRRPNRALLSCLTPLPPLTDWRDPWQRGRRGIVLGVLAFQGELDDDYEADYDGLAAEAVRLTGAVDAFAAYVDPGVGASGYGIGLVLEFMDVAADVVALGTAALALAPKLKRLIESLRARPDIGGISLLPEALEVLVVAEVCRKNGLGPADLVDVTRRDYHPEVVPERRIELQQMFSCSVVTVVASTGGAETLWTYVVTCEGRVVTDTRVDLPTPGAGLLDRRCPSPPTTGRSVDAVRTSRAPSPPPFVGRLLA